MNRDTRFFNRIVEILHSHEDEYIPGAWEEFSVKKTKRRSAIFMWQLIGTAAVLSLFTYFTFEVLEMHALHKEGRMIKRGLKDKNKPWLSEERIAIDRGRKKSLPKQIHRKAGIAKSVTTLLELRHSVQYKANTLAMKKAREKFTKKEIITNRIVKVEVEIKNDSKHGIALSDTGFAKRILDRNFATLPLGNEIADKNKSEMTNIDSLTKRVNPEIRRKKNNKNIVYSLVLSPTLGSNKLNFGTGMEISYKVGNKLSLLGGVIYSSMNAERKGNNRGSGDKKLQDVALAVSGFEVPIGLQYRTKRGFYATCGISNMSVISDRVEYNYLIQTTQIVTIVSGGVPRDIVTINTRESTEQSQENIRNYIGFYTFSAGTERVFGNKNLNLGPFIKIPFGSVSSEKINLTQGGLRLSLAF